MSLNSFSSVSRSLSGSIVIVGGSVKDALESVQLCWLELLLVCTLIVAVGVVAEEWVEHASGDHRWTVEPEWHKTLARIGWILVILGVVGEGAFEAGIFFADRNLQGYNDMLLAITTDQAHNAAASAKVAHEDADAVKLEARDLDRKLSATKTQLEAVDVKRAELEKSLLNMAVCNAPRVLPLLSWTNAGVIKSDVDPLKLFARQVIIEFTGNDAEARRAALSIASALKAADWSIIKLATTFGRVNDGVEVQSFQAPLPNGHETEEWNAMRDAETDSDDAADAVVRFLHSHNWQAIRSFPIDDSGMMIRDPKIMPPHSLRIRIGLYPPVEYVSPPATKEFAEQLAKMEKERKEIEAKLDSETLKGRTTEETKALIAIRNKWRNDQKFRMELYSTGPCRTIPSSEEIR